MEGFQFGPASLVLQRFRCRFRSPLKNLPHLRPASTLHRQSIIAVVQIGAKAVRRIGRDRERALDQVVIRQT